MEVPSSRVSAFVFKILIGLFFGLAMVTASARIAIRLGYKKRLRVDDHLLVLSYAFLTAATGGLYYGTSLMFSVSELTFNPAEALKAGINEADVLRKANLVPKIKWTYLMLSWLAHGFLQQDGWWDDAREPEPATDDCMI
ncbi:MAG: hypothetical protein Q9179_000982 [Wetmoreana sp. 5 TL-2023]